MGVGVTPEMAHPEPESGRGVRTHTIKRRRNWEQFGTKRVGSKKLINGRKRLQQSRRKRVVGG